jgi:hypothetical protein
MGYVTMPGSKVVGIGNAVTTSGSLGNWRGGNGLAGGGNSLTVTGCLFFTTTASIPKKATPPKIASPVFIVYYGFALRTFELKLCSFL